MVTIEGRANAISGLSSVPFGAVLPVNVPRKTRISSLHYPTPRVLVEFGGVRFQRPVWPFLLIFNVLTSRGPEEFR